MTLVKNWPQGSAGRKLVLVRVITVLMLLVSPVYACAGSTKRTDENMHILPKTWSTFGPAPVELLT